MSGGRQRDLGHDATGRGERDLGPPRSWADPPDASSSSSDVLTGWYDCAMRINGAGSATGTEVPDLTPFAGPPANH